jgi:hypothetical protein
MARAVWAPAGTAHTVTNGTRQGVAVVMPAAVGACCDCGVLLVAGVGRGSAGEVGGAVWVMALLVKSQALRLVRVAGWAQRN